MKVHLVHTHLPVPRSRSSARVKYDSPIFKEKKCHFGGISVSQTQLVIFVRPPPLLGRRGGILLYTCLFVGWSVHPSYTTLSDQ